MLLTAYVSIYIVHVQCICIMGLCSIKFWLKITCANNPTLLTGPGGYYEEPDYYHHGPPDAGGYPPHGPPHPGGPHGPPGGNGNLVSYPPIRSSNRGGYGGGGGGGGSGGGGGGGGPQGMGGSGAPPRTKHMVRLRGLPYSAKEQDIVEFFQPLVCSRVIMDFDQFGRPSGEAEVFFQTHDDAQTAMKKNNHHIGELTNKCTYAYMYMYNMHWPVV